MDASRDRGRAASAPPTWPRRFAISGRACVCHDAVRDARRARTSRAHARRATSRQTGLTGITGLPRLPGREEAPRSAAPGPRPSRGSRARIASRSSAALTSKAVPRHLDLAVAGDDPEPLAGLELLDLDGQGAVDQTHDLVRRRGAPACIARLAVDHHGPRRAGSARPRAATTTRARASAAAAAASTGASATSGPGRLGAAGRLRRQEGGADLLAPRSATRRRRDGAAGVDQRRDLGQLARHSARRRRRGRAARRRRSRRRARARPAMDSARGLAWSRHDSLQDLAQARAGLVQTLPDGPLAHAEQGATSPPGTPSR